MNSVAEDAWVALTVPFDQAVGAWTHGPSVPEGSKVIEMSSGPVVPVPGGAPVTHPASTTAAADTTAHHTATRFDTCIS